MVILGDLLAGDLLAGDLLVGDLLSNALLTVDRVQCLAFSIGFLHLSLGTFKGGSLEMKIEVSVVG